MHVLAPRIRNCGQRLDNLWHLRTLSSQVFKQPILLACPRLRTTLQSCHSTLHSSQVQVRWHSPALRRHSRRSDPRSCRFSIRPIASLLRRVTCRILLRRWQRHGAINCHSLCKRRVHLLIDPRNHNLHLYPRALGLQPPARAAQTRAKGHAGRRAPGFHPSLPRNHNAVVPCSHSSGCSASSRRAGTFERRAGARQSFVGSHADFGARAAGCWSCAKWYCEARA